MKNFVLDSTYKDAVIVNSNDDFSITPAHILPNNPISKYEINSSTVASSYISHETQNDKLNKYNLIDYI